MALRKHLTPVGNSLGVVLDKSLLEAMEIDRDTPLDLVVVETGLLIRRALGGKDERRERVRASMKRVMAAQKTTLAKLAK